MITKASAVEQVRSALLAQRQAAVAGDLAALESAGRSLEQALSLLQREQPAANFRQTLISLRQEASVNAQLVQKAAAGNQRALSVFFESAATYGSDGAGRLASPTRKLNAA